MINSLSTLTFISCTNAIAYLYENKESENHNPIVMLNKSFCQNIKR